MSEAVSRVVKALYEDIVLGVFPLGSRLVEEPLVQRYDVKRHVLREAFAQLEEMMFVVRVPNRGVLVHEPSPREIRELYDFRVLIESHAAACIPLPAPKAVTRAMREVQAAYSAALKVKDFRTVLHLNNEFHRTLYSACENRTLTSAIEEYAARTHLIAAMKYFDDAIMARTEAQHYELIAAMEGRDRQVLVSLVVGHFNLNQVDRYDALYRHRHRLASNAG
ncbi:GntR family transcriptional regulator [Algihabitans albus]|uniref:GntR family transcriptional regulator n=1 Tax=Algihabitans albus TaxID=2164067 RepID=UPI0013C2E235|nr:GntR family transcriptional regulator [Algihabitans albus]